MLNGSPLLWPHGEALLALELRNCCGDSAGRQCEAGLRLLCRVGVCQQLAFQLAVGLSREFAITGFLRKLNYPKLADETGFDRRDCRLAAMQDGKLGGSTVKCMTPEDRGVAKHQLLGK
ncbi:hypothetical protein D9M68_473120 [compost metagenome]